MYATTLPRSNWLRRASIRLAWYRHMPASSCLLICYSTLVKLFNFFIIYFFLLCYHYMVNKDVYKAIKNWVVTEGRSNPWGDVDQMSLVGRYAGRNHVCNIWWMSVKGCGCGERSKFAFSHCLMPRPYNIGTLQHWSHCVYAYTQADCHVLPHTLCHAGKNKLQKSLINSSQSPHVAPTL